MRILTLIVCSIAINLTTGVLAAPAPPPPPPTEPNCLAVYNACTQAGYIYGDAGHGNGLYRDCVGPLVTGTPPPKAPPPGVNFPAQVAPQAKICHQNHPKWGVAR